MPTKRELEVKKFWERVEPVALTLDRFDVRVYENEKAVVISKEGFLDTNKTRKEPLYSKIFEIGADFIDQNFGKQDEYYIQDLTEISKNNMVAIRVMCIPDYITGWRNLLSLLKQEYPKYGFPRFTRILDDDPELLDEIRYATMKVCKRYGVFVKHEKNDKYLFHDALQDLPEELLQTEFEKSLRNAFETESKGSMLYTLLEDLEKLPFRVKDRIRYELEIQLKMEKPYEFDEKKFLIEDETLLIDEITKLREEITDLRNQLEKLPERQLKAIYLLYFKDMSKTEAAKELNISVTRIAQLEKTALNNLKSDLSVL